MPRVDVVPDPTQMVELEAVRDGSYECLVRPAVGDILLMVTNDLTVAAGVPTGGPQPAFCDVATVNLVPKTLIKRSVMTRRHVLILAVLVRLQAADENRHEHDDQ